MFGMCVSIILVFGHEDINLVAKCLEDIISSEKHLGGEEYNSTIGELWSLLESIKEREQNIGNEINNCIMHAQKELMANSASSLRQSEASLYLSDSTRVTSGTHEHLSSVTKHANLPPVETVMAFVPSMSPSFRAQSDIFDMDGRNATLGAVDLLKSADFMSRSTELILKDILKR